MTESDIKSAIKGYLNLMGIFNFPITQGLGSYKGAPDRIMHFQGRVCYLEIKTPKGKLSDWQEAFKAQCEQDGIEYFVVRNLDEVIEVTGEG